jgi:hypothetical protein
VYGPAHGVRSDHTQQPKYAQHNEYCPKHCISFLTKDRYTACHSFLKTPDKHENNDNEKYESYASRWNIAPLAAMGPPGQSTQECQNQDHD